MTFVSTANSAHNVAETKASSTAATTPDQIRAPRTQNAIAGPITTATTAQVCSDTRWSPAAGSPSATNTATAAASRMAQPHSRLLKLCLVSQAYTGSANSNDVT